MKLLLKEIDCAIVNIHPQGFGNIREAENGASFFCCAQVIRDCVELERFVAIRELLQGNCLVLILPDANESNITLAHSLCPCFISYVDSNFEDMGAVLSKMQSNFLRTKNASDHVLMAIA